MHTVIQTHLKILVLSVALGKQLKWPDDYFTLTYSLNYTLYDLTNYSLFSPDFRNGYSNNLSFKVGLGRYSVDQPIYPSSGSNLLVVFSLHRLILCLNRIIINRRMNLNCLNTQNSG